MLSIKAITNAASAAKYYSAKDNYYLSDSESLDEATGWYGKGATALNLSGQVNPDVFLQLLQGRLPSGQQLGKIGPFGEIEHRPATDITFSAPKSVSLLALVGGDKRLIEAHNLAVRDALDVIESMAAEARVTIGGKTQFEKTNNLVVALFQHTTSRELDPLLHDHGVVMNMTERADGQWRSLSSRSKQDKENPDHGFRELIYRNQHYFGLVYMSSLAKRTCDMGHEIEIKDRFGNFEIKGVPDDYIEDHSKRRQQILKSMRDKGLTSAKAAECANLDTRRSKESVDSQSLLDYWKAQALRQGVDLSAVIEQSKTNNRGSIKPMEGMTVSECARDAVNDALEHLSPFRTKIKHADLVRTAFVFSTGTILHEEIEADIATRFREESLLGVASDYYTTHDLLQQEKAFVKQCKGGLDASFSVQCNTSGVASNMLGSKDRLQIIDVNGLTHEKNLIESLVHQTEAEGLKAVVLHVGRLQTNRLNASLSRDNSTLWKSVANFFKADLVQTVAGFSARYDKANPAPCTQNDVLIVHDAQKLSYRDLSTLEHLTARTDSKLVLLNNTRSSDGFSAGSPLKALKEAGFTASVSKTHEKKVSVDVVETTTAHADLAAHFAALPQALREKTQVIALTQKDCASINGHIRNQLQRAGALSMQTKEIACLSTQTLSETQKKHAQFYEVGDQVTMNPFERGQEHYRVVSKQEKTLCLEDASGAQKTISIDERHNALITKTQTLALSVGEQLVTEKNIQRGQARFQRGELFSVEALQEEGVLLKNKGINVYFSNAEFSDLSMGYHYARRPSAVTKSAESVLMALNGYQLNKNNLGEIAEFASTIKIFTEDKGKAITQLDKAQLHWTISDVATGAISRLYRDISFAKDPLHQDLEDLSQALCGAHHGMPAEQAADLAVSYTMAKLSERDAAFEHKTLLTDAMHFALGKSRLLDIERAIEQKAASGTLIHADTHWISKEALALERTILMNNLNEQGALTPICSHGRLLALPNTLTQGQKDAISLGLSTQDRFVSVQGLAGVGKTTMMRTLQTMAKKEGYAVVGLAPMHTSKDELIASGIESITIARFLTEDAPYSEKTLFVIDESSMIGNRDYAAIQQKIIQWNAKGLFAGDITQLQSPSSGVPHELSIKTGTQKTAYMSEIIRQKDSPVLKKAVIHASDREIKASFATLASMNPEAFVKRREESASSPQRSVIAVKCTEFDKATKQIDYSPVYQAIANDYLTRIPEHQEKTMVIAHAHEDRSKINALIREGLQQQGSIDQKDVGCQRLPAKSMTKAELLHVKNYAPNDVLRFDASFSVAEKGGYFTVDSINDEHNQLHCISEQGDRFTINPALMALKTRMSVYTQEQSALATGDRIRLRLTDKARGHVSNKEYTVMRMEDGHAHLQSNDQTKTLTLQLNDKKDMHWDYAYSRTAFGAQSATVTFVLALELAKRQLATAHRSHEIDITRAAYQATIYTEDESKLVSRLSELKGDKLSAFHINARAKAHAQEKTIASPSTEGVSDARKESSLPQDVHHQVSQRAMRSVSTDEINQALVLQMQPLAEQLLGKPNGMSTATNLRYGSRGSLSIHTPSGLWNNFETGEKGNALQLISVQMGFSDFKETLAYAKAFLNNPDMLDVREKPSIDLEKITEKETPNKKKLAKKLYDMSVPIKGTLAERYLKEYRKLNHYKEADLRFIPRISTWHQDKKVRVPALLCIGRDTQGALNHLQVIRLNPKTGDKDLDSKIVKQTYGAMKGCPVELNKTAKSDITYLAEGVETGLSIVEGDANAKVFALMGKSNFKNIDLSKLTHHVVLCLDNDIEATLKDFVIEKSVARLIREGKSVSIMMPDKPGDDFNDVLKKEGPSKIMHYMKNTVDAKSFLIEARQQLNKQLDKDNSKNNELIKKIITIENNQLSDFNELDHALMNQLHQMESLSKSGDEILLNKSVLNAKSMETNHHILMTIEKNRLTHFDAENQVALNRMHEMASFQKHQDARMANRSQVPIQVTHQKIIEKEMG